MIRFPVAPNKFCFKTVSNGLLKIGIFVYRVFLSIASKSTKLVEQTLESDDALNSFRKKNWYVQGAPYFDLESVRALLLFSIHFSGDIYRLLQTSGSTRFFPFFSEFNSLLMFDNNTSVVETKQMIINNKEFDESTVFIAIQLIHQEKTNTKMYLLQKGTNITV